ncbi:MAG: hypothetical protein AAFU49_22810, partial [Pseudomonadota bacterium]
LRVVSRQSALVFIVFAPADGRAQFAIPFPPMVKAAACRTWTIIVIDKNLDALKALADRHVILAKGEVVWTGTTTELDTDASVVDRYLHV